MEIEKLYSLFKKFPNITTDSRNCPKKSIFFALKGERFNGNQYARKAIEAGCACAIVDEPEFADEKGHILLTNNVLETLQKLANYHRRRFAIPVIAITGTNGKTTTKELVAAVLRSCCKTLCTKGNLNNHIGVPLTLLQLTQEHEIAVIEMGANHPGEIAELCAIAEPDYGLITNVGKAHLEGFGSFEGVIAAKTELYDFLRSRNGFAFLDIDNPYLPDRADQLRVCCYGTSEDTASVAGSISGNDPFLTVEWHFPDGNLTIFTHLIGDYNLSNVLAAVCVGRYFGVPEQLIVDAIAAYEPVNNRSQWKETEKNRLIIDVYNANPGSMQAAIKNFATIKASRKCVIFGDMLELGAYSAEEHRRIVDQLKSIGIAEAFLCGEEFSDVPENPYKTFKNTDELVDFLASSPLQGYTILMKGSRGMQLEKAIDLL